MPGANRLLVMEEGDRTECKRIVGSRKTAVSTAKRAQVLVLATRGLSNRRIALELGANAQVVGRVRKEYGAAAISCITGSTSPGPTAQQSGRAKDSKGGPNRLPGAGKGAFAL